jgi:kinetochore protein Mis12/MTW1
VIPKTAAVGGEDLDKWMSWLCYSHLLSTRSRSHAHAYSTMSSAAPTPTMNGSTTTTGEHNGASNGVIDGPGTDVLLAEILGFQPQYLLDDIFNVAQEAALSTVNAMQEYLNRWAERRGHTGWTAAEEIEQGLVSLQTLLDTHVDQAFDFFEVWTRRNILTVSLNDGPLVLPHQEGLDLGVKQGREVELMAEIEELRRKKENVCDSISPPSPAAHIRPQMHRLNNVYTRAVAVSAQKRAFSEARLAQLAFLSSALPTHPGDKSAALAQLSALPARLDRLREALADMPTEEAIVAASDARADDAEMRRQYGKRDWENLRGYTAWAAQRAVQADPEADVGSLDSKEDPLDAEWRKRQERAGALTTDGLADLAALEDNGAAARSHAASLADHIEGMEIS